MLDCQRPRHAARASCPGSFVARWTSLAVMSLASVVLCSPAAAADNALVFQKGDRIALVGNTLAERLQLFNHFETQLLTRYADLDLIVRNLGWSADTVTLQPRPLNFGDATTHLTRQQADVVVAFFGVNESFAGEAGLPPFEQDLDTYLRGHLAARYNGTTAPRVVLVSPIAHERLPHLVHVDVDARNRELARYTEAMRRVASAKGVLFVDLFTPTRALMSRGTRPLTINGIHLNEEGDRLVASLLLSGLGVPLTSMRAATPIELTQLEALREQVRDKNQQFFYRWRPLNAEYIVGRRVEPFGAVNFPGEMKQLEDMVAEREQTIWATAKTLQGVRYPDAAAVDASADAGRGAR